MSALAQPPSRPLRTDFSVVDTGFLSDTYKEAKKAAKEAIKNRNEWYEKARKGIAAAREAMKNDKKKDEKEMKDIPAAREATKDDKWYEKWMKSIAAAREAMEDDKKKDDEEWDKAYKAIENRA